MIGRYMTHAPEIIDGTYVETAFNLITKFYMFIRLCVLKKNQFFRPLNYKKFQYLIVGSTETDIN